MKTGLREKFLIPTILLILLGTVSTAMVSYVNSRNMLGKTIDAQLQQSSGSTVEYITSWVENRKQDIILWSQQSTTSQAIGIASSDVAADSSDTTGSIIFTRELLDNLKSYKKAHPYFEELGVARENGQIITSSSEEVVRMMTNKNIKDKDYFQRTIKGEVVLSEVQLSDSSSKPVLIISAPVKYNEAIVGILYGVVDLPYFTKKFVEPIKIGQSGFVYIFDKEGMIISHPDATKIMKTSVKNSDFGRQMIEKGEGVLNYKSAGQENMVSFKKDKSLGWTVAAEVSVDEMLQPIKKLARLSMIMTVVIVILAVIVIILVAAWVSKPINKITGSLNLVAEQVSDASSQISQSSQQLAQGASSQASSIEETSASLEELASMANHNADNAQQANNLANDAREAANKGAASMDNLMKAMDGINTSSREVAKVAKGIEEIAFQTNLLALNAAVEAARAGEAGKGFAVVAEEVRNLAQRASEQAKTTSTLITESRTRTKDGSTQAAEAQKVLKLIQDSVAKVVGLVTEITAASREQAQGIDQINKAVSTMDQIVQQNSASSEQSASASEELSAQAFQMKSLVRKLGRLVSGSGQAAVKRKGRRVEEDEEEDEEVFRPRKPKFLSRSEETPRRHAKAQDALPAPGRREPVEVRAEEIIPFDDDDMKDF